MISRIRGLVLSRNERAAVVEANGIGYKIFLTQNFLKKLPLGKEVQIQTYLSAKENSMELYGFETEEGLNFFEMLISVSGIGPKTALNILNIAEVKTIREAVSTGDINHLTKVSGIGKKNAEKIVLELRDKLGFLGTSEENLREDVDALEGLKSLGYTQMEAREALKKVSPEIKSVSEKIKQALKVLS